MIDRVRLTTIPSADAAFADFAFAALTEVARDVPAEDALGEFRRRLQAAYPGAIVRPREFLADVGGGDEIVWYATNRASRSRIAAALDVPVAVETAFAIYVERVVDWQTAVHLRPRRLTTELVGSEWGATWSFLGRNATGLLRLTEADRPHSVRFEATGMGIHVWYDTTFLPSRLGTLVRVVGDYDVPDGIVPRIVDRLFMERGIQRQIDQAHEALRALCARAAGPSGAGPSVAD